MNRLLSLLLAMVTLFAAPLLAQDITGTWQGTMSPGGHDLRMVLKITKADGAMKGEVFSIDQSPRGFATGPISQTNGDIQFAVPGIGGADYHGKLSPDGKSISGNWSQGGSPIPLNLTHATPESAWPMPSQSAVLPPMPANADPTFEVATIKPAKPGEQGPAITLQGRQFRGNDTSIALLITFAYGIHPKQIVGAPGWVTSEKFDIEAEPDVVGVPSAQQLKSMIRKLLKDRFQLTTHKDRKELSVYALTVAKGGPKLISSADRNGLPGLFFRGLGKMVVQNASMTDFAQTMEQAVLDRPVVDQTALTGRYDFTLNWTPDESQFGGLGIRVPPPSDKTDALPSLFTAMQEQLGLKLEPTKAQTEVLVIDKVEHPSDN